MFRSLASGLRTVSTTAEHEVGAKFTEAQKDAGNVWVYVFNDEASASFVQGTVVAQDTSSGDIWHGIKAPTSAAPVRVLGVAQWTIAAGSYGFILCYGKGEVLAGTGAITANNPLIVDGTDAGTATDAATAATDAAFGWATEAATATNLATCVVKCL